MASPNNPNTTRIFKRMSRELFPKSYAEFWKKKFISMSKNSVPTTPNKVKNTIGNNISSLEEPAPNVITVPMTGTNVPTGSGASGSSSSNTPTSTIPSINSSDVTNPYVPYSESVYGVHD